MRVSRLKECVAIQLAQSGGDFLQDLGNELAPPSLVVIFPRAVDRRPRWHPLPAMGERPVERARIQVQADLFADERIMIANTLGQVDQRPGGVEKDGFIHASNYRSRPPRCAFRFSDEDTSYYQMAMLAGPRHEDDR